MGSGKKVEIDVTRELELDNRQKERMQIRRKMMWMKKSLRKP